MRCLILTCLIVGFIATTVRAQPTTTDPGVHSFEKEHWGFTVVLPKTWNVQREVDVPEQFRVSFGMPKIWSEKENAHIENAISVYVYRGNSFENVNDVVRLEQERIADILISKKLITVENGIGFDSRTRLNRLEYVYGRSVELKMAWVT